MIRFRTIAPAPAEKSVAGQAAPATTVAAAEQKAPLADPAPQPKRTDQTRKAPPRAKKPGQAGLFKA